MPNSEELQDFVFTELMDTNLYTLPERMTVEEAEYCLKYYQEDNFPIPADITAESFAKEWNQQLEELLKGGLIHE